MPISFRVVFGLLLMDFAVYFHDQSSGVTVEIHNESINDLLAAEVEAVQSIGTELLPENLLLLSHLATKFFGTPHLGRIHLLSNDDITNRHRIPP